jgi:hypothetical protein
VATKRKYATLSKLSISIQKIGHKDIKKLPGTSQIQKHKKTLNIHKFFIFKFNSKLKTERYNINF